MKVVITGAGGFLGWHTRARLQALTDHDVVAVTRADWARLDSLVSDADAVVHIAGVNRGPDDEVAAGNLELASDLARAVRRSDRAPRVVFANSVHAGRSTAYGEAKAGAAQVLAAATGSAGSAFVDVLLPNLFGEHGRPRYNSFVATFVEAVVAGEEPTVSDSPIVLLHAQGAAEALLDGLSGPSRQVVPEGTPTSVAHVYRTLRDFDATYTCGDFPALTSAFDVDLFNTLRAARFPEHSPIPLQPRSDERGRLVETVRVHGGAGQTFVSTTRPGVTRGEHFHLRKIERFAVLSGSARISLRRLYTDQVVSFDVTGESPVAVDMPTMWVHNITNTGTDELVTLFWANELFDPAAPDTFAEKVL